MNRSAKNDDHEAMVPTKISSTFQSSYRNLGTLSFGKIVKGAGVPKFIISQASNPSDYVDMSTGLSFVCDCVTTATSFFLHRR